MAYDTSVGESGIIFLGGWTNLFSPERRIKDVLLEGLLSLLRRGPRVTGLIAGSRTEHLGRCAQTETAFSEGVPELFASVAESIDTWKDVAVSSNSCMATCHRI